MPPFVGVIEFPDIRMIRSAKKINFPQIVGISEVIDYASVESSSAIRNIGMAMYISPVKSISFTIHFPFVAIIGRPFGRLVRVGEVINF